MPSSLNLWMETFRPRNISECILPNRIKKCLLQMEASGEYQHMLFVGGPGRGKTTCAKVLCSHPNLIVRAPELAFGFDKNVAEALHFFKNFLLGDTYTMEEVFKRKPIGCRKIVLVDEAQEVRLREQELMKKWMEHPFLGATFLLVLNDEKDLLPALRSRCVRFDFEPTIEEYKELMQQARLRCEDLALRNRIDVTAADIEAIVKTSFPDLRVMVNELYKLSLLKAG